MDDPADVSSQNRPGWHLLDEGSPTRNRKVVGSNPTSGSISAGQKVFLAMLTGQRQQAVIPLVGHRAVSASAHFATRSPSGRLSAPSMDLLRRPTPGGIVEDGMIHGGSAFRDDVASIQRR
jgi:hypothetical protein